MHYLPPIGRLAFLIRHVLDVGDILAAKSVDWGTLQTVLEEAGTFCAERIAPLNRSADMEGASLQNGKVTTPSGWREAYRAWTAAGWNGMSLPTEYGGSGLPLVVGTATMEMLTSASMAFATLPVLTQGAVDALAVHASDDLKLTYLPRMVAGAWPAAMNLTEPQAGSDLSGLTTRATPAADGAYRVTGQKMFITFGEHDLTDNIVHLVLARLPDAPAGTKGISLFLVPKFLDVGGGRFNQPNDIRCAGIEHKLGIRGSPTCTMIFGERGGATGYLVGEPHRGLAAMFTMMNKARLATGLQGVAVAERATQRAAAFAQERRQGRAADGSGPVVIVSHPDVRRNLLTMRTLTEAARALAYSAAAAIDRANTSPVPELAAAARERADLLTPVVKAYCSEIGVDVASLGIQVHGGMGYIEETGAAQDWRDARIAPIYEGTNGIQAIDLVTRKIGRAEGAAVWDLLSELRRSAGGLGGATVEALDALETSTRWLVDRSRSQEERLAGATPYLRLFGLAISGAMLAKSAAVSNALSHGGSSDAHHLERMVVTQFHTENLAVAAHGLARQVTGGSASVLASRGLSGLCGEVGRPPV